MAVFKRFLKDKFPIVQTGVSGAVAYTTGVIINLVTKTTGDGGSFWVLLVGGFLICVTLIALSAAVDAVKRGDEARLKREYNAHRSGYQTLNREISQYMRLVRNLGVRDDEISRAPVELMQNACRDLYDTLEMEYGYDVRVSEHVEFEVTFMTTSIQDGEITIAAWANRDARAPKSLAERKGDPTRYHGTETDRLYQDPNRSPRIISSTSTEDYKELYPGQKRRIRSTIVYPVVDEAFALQGTIVVHCDEEGFFDSASEKLWRELLEPYTKRLALARLGADKAQDYGFGTGF